MGWQDIYKKKMQAAGLENDIRSTDDVQVFYRKEPEQYGDWRDSFMKKMEDSGLSGDIRLGQTQTAARQTVTAPATTTTAAKKRERQVVSPYGTFLGGFSFARGRQKSEKELADEKAQQEAYVKEYRRLAGLDLDDYRAEVEQAGKKAQESKEPYNIHAFGAYNPQKTKAEQDYAAMKADLNKAESIQYDSKGREALDNLTEDQTAALEVLASTEGVPAAAAQADYDRKVAARETLLASGLSEDELSQLVNYQRNIPKREKNAERYAKVQEMARNEGEKSPIGGTLLSVPANLLSGIGTVYTAVEKLRNPDTPADYHSPAMLPYAYASGVRGEVTKNLQYDHGDVAAFAYGVGTSMLDSAATVALAALGVPPAAASATLGGAAATDAMVAAKERGLDDGHAIVIGVAAGVMESFFEKVSLESLIHMKLPAGTAKQKLAGMLKNAAIQGGIEGSEEMFTDLANLWWDKVINGGMADVEQRIAVYMAGGMSYQEAQQKVVGETIKDIALDFGAGALAGGLMGGGNMAVQTAAQGRYQDAMQQVRQQSGVTGAYQASEDGRTTYHDTDAQIRSVVKDGKVQLESGETVDPKDVRFKDQQTADLYEGAINTAENAGAAQVFVDSYTGGDVSQYLLGMRQAYEAGRAGIPVEEMTRGTFADDLSEAQRSAAYEQGRLATEAEFPTMGDMGLGESGSAAWAKAEKINTTLSKGKVQAGFTVLYQAGLRRESAANVKSEAASALPQSVQTAAYEAGLSDAAASLAREKAGLDFVSSAGSESGLVDNEHSRKMAKEQAGTAALLNTLGKNLGVRIEMVDTISGGKANGVYIGGKNLIQIAADADNAFGFVAAHEVTHRMQELAPEEYRAYRDHAMSYRARESGEEGAAAYVERYRAMAEKAGVKLTQEEAMDEIAADFTRDMMENGNLFEDFAKENRSGARKLLDALKAFIAKVKSLFHSKTAQDRAAQDAYGKSMAQLEQCVALWQKAYDAAGKQAQRAKTAAREGDGKGRYQLKSFSEQAVSTALYDALSEKATRQNQLIPVSVMPRYISEKLGIGGDIYIQRDHAYENMVSKEQAIQDGRPTQRKGEDVHFHDLGVEKMTRAIMSINEPTMTIATKTKDGNPAVIMMLPEYGSNDAPLYAVLSFYSSKSLNGDFSVRPHVVLTIAERNFFEDGGRVGWDEVIYNAINDGRVLDFNKKERQNLTVIAQPAGLGNITDASLKKNLAQFQKEVKRFRESNNIRYQLKSATELEQEVRELTKYAAYRQRGTTDREILLSAAEGSAKTEWERKRLAEYRDAVGRLEGYEARLSANRAELTGLSLADGKKNAKRISYLEDEITKDTNRVAIVENKLKDLEGNRSLQELLGRERAMLQQQERTYLGKVEELLGGYRGLYGTMRKGEKAARDIQLPKKSSEDEKISQTVRTVLEAKATPEEMVPDIETLALEGKYSYEVYSDKAAIADASRTIKRVGWAQALTDWKSAMKAGNVSKKNTAMGWALYNNAANSGDTETALDVLSDMVQHQRSAAQALQATRILKQLSPETQLYQAQRSIANLQTQLNEEYGDDKAPKLKIDQTLAEQFMKAADQAERDAVLANIYRDIGKQMPSRFKDKWNAWRYLAMLGNVRTHVRNVVGNAGFVPVVAAKNAVATGIEKAVYRLSGGKMQRSKEFVTGKGGKALLEAAAQDYAKVADVAMGGGKYSDFANANKYIEEGRVIFRTKPLEAARKANSRALDKEDAWFSKPHYAYAMAQYCKANGITAEMIAKGGDKVVKAREYAIKEAQKATYRDTNAFSQAISELGRMGRNSKNGAKRTIATVMEGILPFRKTPANILARGVEYSPIGIIRGMYQATVGVKKGTATAAEAIDSISAGLTGSGLLMLGFFMAAQGVVRGHGDDDDKENDFMELAGHQAYALELPNGTSVTLDWLAPECLPFFVGVNLCELSGGNPELTTMADWLTAMSQVSEPMLEMSCLQSLNDVFDSVGYASSNGLPGLPTALVNAAASYVSQGIPTILGQAERTGEGLRYTTFTSKNSKLTNNVQYALGRASAKIPIWDYSQIPYIDAWGRTESTGEVGTRAFNNFLNPAYTSTVDMSAMEEELLRLYEVTGENVFPSRAKKYFNADNQEINLTGEQYVTYAQKKGGEAYKWLTELTQSAAYRNMSNEEKVECIDYIYKAANEVAKAKVVSSYEPTKWVKEALKGGGVVNAAIAKVKEK